MLEEPDPAAEAARRLRRVLSDWFLRQVQATGTARAAHVEVLAEAVRRAGETAREQGEPEQVRVAAALAGGLQQLARVLSGVDPQRLVADLRSVPTRQRMSRWVVVGRAQASRLELLRVGDAGPGLVALGQVLTRSSVVLDEQGQDGSALLLLVVAARTQLVAGYLSATGLWRLRADLVGYAQRAPSAAAALQTGAAVQVRRRWVPVAVGVVAVVTGGVVLARRSSNNNVAAQPDALDPAASAGPVAAADSGVSDPVAGSAAEARRAPQVAGPELLGSVAPLSGDVARDLPNGVVDHGADLGSDPEATVLPRVEDGDADLERLTRAELRDYARALGLRTDTKMTKKQLVELIGGNR